MRKILKKIIFAPIIAMILTIIAISQTALPCSAAGSVDLFIDVDSKVLVGQTFNLTVRVETTIEAMVNLEIYYDSSAVDCIAVPSSDCSDNGSVISILPISFNTSHKFVCKFKLKKEIPTTFKATVIECGTLAAEQLPTPSLSKTVTGYVATPAPTPTPTAKPTTNTTQTPTATPTQKPTAPINTQTPSYTPFNPTEDPGATPSSPFEFSDGTETRYIAEDFEADSVSMPESFEKRSIKYEGSDISVAENQNGVKLLYTTDIVGQNGKFYIYIEKQKAIIPYLEIPFGKNVYVFTMLDETPESFTKTALNFDQTPAIAYNTSNEKYSDFRILYGFSKGGALSYYLYDTIEGTLQRCVDPSILYGSTIENDTPADENIPSSTPANPTAEKPTSTPERIPVYPERGFKFDKKMLLPVIIATCVLAVVIAIIIIVVRSRRIAESFDNDYENFIMAAENNPVINNEQNYSGNCDFVEHTTSNNYDTNNNYDECSDNIEEDDLPEENETKIVEADTAIKYVDNDKNTNSYSSYYNLDDDEDEILQLRND